MTLEEQIEWQTQMRKRNSYFSDKAAPFSDYVKNPKEKYVIVITKSQYVFHANIAEYDHVTLTTDIIKEIRPDLEIDWWGNSLNSGEDFREHNILIFGYPRYSLISLPSKERISPEQYKELEQIILNIKEYNEKEPRKKWELYVDAPMGTNIESGYCENELDKLLMSLEEYTTEDYKAPQETIIGKPISKNEHLQQYKNSI